jgi:hypothetical protein
MPDGTTERPLAVVSRAWLAPGSEAAFVARSLAGAFSRRGPVAVLVPSLAVSPQADGLFDLVDVGGHGDRWPTPDRARWPSGLRPAAALVEPGDDAAMDLLSMHEPGVPVVTVPPARPAVGYAAILNIAGPGEPAPPAGATPVADVGMFVPVNPLAATHRHNGIGFVDYLLVLTDRAGRPAPAPPTAAVAWLTARFPREPVVVVEGGTATVWRGRARRGEVGVDSRTDLWRLMAHARLVIDLAPGAFVAREAVEAMRFGVPVVVPAGTAVAVTASDGGAGFESVGALFDLVEALADRTRRDRWGAAARRDADARFGSGDSFAAAAAAALTRIVAAV